MYWEIFSLRSMMCDDLVLFFVLVIVSFANFSLYYLLLSHFQFALLQPSDFSFTSFFFSFLFFFFVAIFVFIGCCCCFFYLWYSNYSLDRSFTNWTWVRSLICCTNSLKNVCVCVLERTEKQKRVLAPVSSFSLLTSQTFVSPFQVARVSSPSSSSSSSSLLLLFNLRLLLLRSSKSHSL